MTKNLEEHEEGINYDKVFAIVARIDAIRLFLAYASIKDFVVYQMDVKSDFLYGKIKEEVYVCQPPGFEDSDFPDRLYKVENALYGLHQAPKAWYETLSTYLLDNGFQRGKIDKTLIIRRDKGDILLVQVYLKGQPKLGLWYPKDSPFDLEAYTDSDYAGASLDRNPQTGRMSILEPIVDEAVNEENVPTQSNDPPISRVNILGSGEDILTLKELMLGDHEDASKKRRNSYIDQDVEVTLVNETQGKYDDVQMFDTDVFNVCLQQHTTEDITVCSTLAALRSAKPKIVMKEQIRLDKELAFKLQAEEEEQARLAKEKAEKVEEANIS
ncbi:putative ribonuclease H-like domain-containing protein [Tanacetum coccineum]